MKPQNNKDKVSQGNFRAKSFNTFESHVEKFRAECLKSFDRAFRAKSLNFLLLISEIKHERIL